ncbi:MAG: oligoendopeptidase F [Bacilli bacterium]
MDKRRDEIESKYKWDLESIYKNKLELEKDIKKIENMKNELLAKKDSIMISALNLYQFLEEFESVNILLEKIYVYAKMKSDEDKTNNEYLELSSIIDNINTKFEESFSFLRPLFLSYNYSIIEQYFKEEPRLLKFKRYLEEIFRYKIHTLSKEEEKIISSFSNILNKSNDTAALIRNAEIKFTDILDSKGQSNTLNNSNYTKYLTSFDRVLRKNAFFSMYKAYEGLKNTLASTLYGEIEGNVLLAKTYKYNSIMEYLLFSDNVNVKIVDNLIKTVNDNLSVLFKYYDVKKTILNLDEFHLYDLYTPLIKDDTKKYPFAEGKELVIKALSVLGGDYIKIVNMAFDERWIDIYQNVGKRSGAYSWGSYATKPFMLLNYNDRLNDVSTLAHEMGHSIHSYLSKNNNSYTEASYKIFVAEVASTVNELLLYKYMLKNSHSKKEKLIILNELMELFKSTIYRQTMFCEFDKLIYQTVEQGNVLTSKYLEEEYLKLNKKYFNCDIIIDDDIKYEWMRISHFYMNFYVYKYATGLSSACYIVNKILTEKENYIPKYLEFLKSGNKDEPINILKIAGVDITNPNVIKSAINMFDETIDEFIKLNKN